MKWPVALLSLLTACPLVASPVLVGKFPAKIVPEQLNVLTLPEHGTVTDLIAEGHVTAGTVIAILNKERTQQEREDMEFSIAKERITTRDELRKLLQQREKLLFYLNLSADERKFAADTVSSDGSIPTAESLADIDERISLTRRELSTMEKRKRDEFERSHEKMTLRMPYTGRLQYNVTLPEDKTQPFEITGMVQTFATVCDDSSYYVTIIISRSDMSLLPEKKFSVRVPLPENRELVGTYAFRRVERASNGADALVYFFRLPKEDSETAFGMLGSNTTATLYFDVDDEVERVSKAQLAAHPVAGECESWEELVARVYPGAVVVIVADRDIVIRHPQTGTPQPEPAVEETRPEAETKAGEPQLP